MSRDNGTIYGIVLIASVISCCILYKVIQHLASVRLLFTVLPELSFFSGHEALKNLYFQSPMETRLLLFW